jgi:hypothetical protein
MANTSRLIETRPGASGKQCASRVRAQDARIGASEVQGYFADVYYAAVEEGEPDFRPHDGPILAAPLPFRLSSHCCRASTRKMEQH